MVAPRIVLEATARTLYSQVNVVSLRSDREGRDRGGNTELDHRDLAVYPSTRSRPPGLQWRTKKEGSLEPMTKYQKYLRQKCSLEAALIVHRRMRIRVAFQPSQHPSASLGQLATLEVLQHRHPSAILGQTLL